LVASIGSYTYSTSADTLYVHLYNQNRTRLTLGGNAIQIEQHTNYPWDGDIHFKIQVDQPTQFDLALRIPGWCRNFQLAVNGTSVVANPVNGYVRVSRQWSNGDEVSLSLAMPVERMTAHPDVRHNAGAIALQRGPIVYCLEEVDNGQRLANIAVPRDSRMNVALESSLFSGVSVITGDAVRVEPANWPGGLYQPQSVVPFDHATQTFKAIPYCFWANRQPGEMRVWVREA
jgi:DUF1680 family protein